jgi:hypothetical protein
MHQRRYDSGSREANGHRDTYRAVECVRYDSAPDFSTPNVCRNRISQHHTSVACQERDRLMDLYLAAAFKAEEINKPEHERSSADWLRVIKEAHRACQSTLEDLKAHRKEHGC